MSSTHFIDTVTEIPADWANDVNALTYDVFNGAQNVAQALTALGLSWAVQTNLHANVTGGTIDAAPIGQTTPAAGTFTVLQATTQGTGANDVALVPFVTSAVATLQASLGSMSLQNATAVDITGGTINNTPIGLSTPAAAAFTSASVQAAPVNANDVANKGYVDSRISGLPLFGTMAVQNANAVTITGGTLDDVIIGGTVPAEAFFLTVTTDHVSGPNGELWLDGALTGYFNYGTVLKASAGSPNIGAVLGLTGSFVVNSSVNTPLLTLDSAGRLVLGGATNDSTHTLQLLGGASMDSLLLSTSVTLPNQAATKQYVDTSIATAMSTVAGQIAAAIGQLGSMAHQDSSAVTVTGGTIDGTVIGATAAANGTFTTLTANNVGNATGKVIFDQATGGHGVLLSALSSTKPNVTALINSGGAFQVINGAQTIAKISSTGRSLFGVGATDDGVSALLVAGQAAVTGQLIIAQAPSGNTSAANKKYVDDQIATVQGSIVTPTWVQQQIATAVAPLASTAYVDNAVTGLVTSTYVDSAIANALTNYATQTYVQQQLTSALATYATQTYVNQQITTALSTYATQTYVQNQLAGYATQSYVTTQLVPYVTLASLTNSTGASIVGYGGTTVKAALDALTASSSTTQAANTVYAGPTTGAAATPTFRALVTADLPQAITTTTLTTDTLSAATSITAPTAVFTGTGAIQLPAGNTAAQPASPVAGMLRFNTQTNQAEFYTGVAWVSYIGPSGGTITGALNVATLNVSSSFQVNTSGGLPITARAGVVGAFTGQGNSGNAHVQLDGYSGAAGTATNVSFTGRAARGTGASPVALSANDWLSGLDGFGYGATSMAPAATGYVAILAEGTFTDASMPTAVAFGTTASGSITSAEAMRISGAGRLLIGTTTDSGNDLVQVNGTISSASINPNVTGVSDFGTSARRWRNTFFTGVSANNAWQASTPAAGATVTVAATTNHLMVDPTATIATLTIAMPASPVDGQYLEMSFSQTVTTITWTGAMQVNMPTTAAAGSSIRVRYNSTAAQWRLA